MQTTHTEQTAAKSRKLLFHIGHHKTGSTSIQDAFATGRVRWDGRKIFYPGKFNHNYLARHFAEITQTGTSPKGSADFPALDQISAQMERGDFDVAIISGEVFEGAKPKDVKQVMQHFLLPHVAEHTVICYVRPHAGRFLSTFAEQVKLGVVSESPAQFFEKVSKDRRFIYLPKLLDWESTFQDQFKLRPMIRAELAGGSVVRDFLETGLGPDCAATITEGDASNESLCLEDLLMLKVIQRHLSARNRQLRHAMGWDIALAFSDLPRPTGEGTRLRLHKTLAERIRGHYLDDAVALDIHFFGKTPLMRVELDRAVDEALQHAQSFDPEDHFNPDTLRSLNVLGTQLNRMLDHKQGPWAGFLLEGRIARLHGTVQTKD